MNLERIVALKPDLVIAWRGGNAERQVDQLASLGIKVMWVDATSIEQIANALRQLAPGVRNRIRPNKPRNPLLDQYAQLKAQYADKPKNVFFCNSALIRHLPVEKSRFRTRYSKFVAEKTSLKTAGFPGRKLAANRC